MTENVSKVITHAVIDLKEETAFVSKVITHAVIDLKEETAFVSKIIAHVVVAPFSSLPVVNITN